MNTECKQSVYVHQEELTLQLSSSESEPEPSKGLIMVLISNEVSGSA